ncbi:hypothetical protein CRYUN_Cryun01aG0138100 [Craigia yunnanensis]
MVEFLFSLLLIAEKWCVWALVRVWQGAQGWLEAVGWHRWCWRIEGLKGRSWRWLGGLEVDKVKSRNQNGVSLVDEVHVGVILDMGSREGKIIHNCVSMAISDFYSLHTDYEVRIVLHTRDSKGNPLLALSAAFNLLENVKVGVILSAQTSIVEAKFLAELGDNAKIPVISFSTAFGSSPSLNNYPYFIQIAQDETAEVKGIAAFIELHNWKNVILIYEDNDNWRDFFEQTKIHIAYKSAVATSSKDYQIIEELQKLKAMQTTVFVVHVSHVLASRLFLNAKRLGMISEGYAWIVTSKSMNHLQNLTDSSIFESMQGVLGFRPYITESKELHNFTSRMRKEVYNKELDMLEMMHLNLYGLWAYDVAWSLAKTANSVVLKVPQISDPDARLNLMDFDNFRTNIQGSVLLQEIFENKLKGLSGEFHFINGKLISSTFEIVNVMGEGERRVGFWTSAGKITKKLHGSAHGRHLSSINDLETIIWPGGTSTIPKGRMMQMSGNILRIGVPVKKGFTQLVKVDRDLQTNATIATGFCIDVFKAALAGLKYDVQYQFIPFVVDYNQIGGTYNDLVYQVYLQKYDAVVGDTTITANRSLYVDFTLPYTDIGVRMVAPKERKNLWIFLKPLTRELWLTIVGVYLLTASIIGLIERPAPVEQGPQSHCQVGRIFWFSFSILVFAHWEKLSSNLSRSVVLLWVFVVFILSSSYTATLTSMMTVQQIELNSKRSNIGHQTGPVTQEVVTNLNFENTTSTSIWFSSPDEYAKVLSKGSKNGGVSAIIDEIPYIKIFLAKYSAHYSMIGPIVPTTNGFGFVFPKGSPLVPDISTEIARLRENGRLQMLENAWFKSPTTFASGDTSDSVNPLTVGDFGGLFLISGTFSALAFLLFFASALYRNWHIMRNWRRPEFVKEYVSMIIFKSRRESNVIHPHPELDNL